MYLIWIEYLDCKFSKISYDKCVDNANKNVVL